MSNTDFIDDLLDRLADEDALRHKMRYQDLNMYVMLEPMEIPDLAARLGYTHTVAFKTMNIRDVTIRLCERLAEQDQSIGMWTSYRAEARRVSVLAFRSAEDAVLARMLLSE